MLHISSCFGLVNSFHLCSVDMILGMKNYQFLIANILAEFSKILLFRRQAYFLFPGLCSSQDLVILPGLALKWFFFLPQQPKSMCHHIWSHLPLQQKCQVSEKIPPLFPVFLYMASNEILYVFHAYMQVCIDITLMN